MTRTMERGKAFPLGSSVCPDGVNFSLYSKHAETVELILFEPGNPGVPGRIIPFDRNKNRTFHYWHMLVRGIGADQVYGYRVSGPVGNSGGNRFDPEKILLDPYGKSVLVPESYRRSDGVGPGDNAPTAMKSVVVDTTPYDWEGDRPLERPFSQTVIYEMHVGGFTRHPGSGVAEQRRGTFAGVVEKIPYLVDLGVTAVELMPVFQFDEQEAPPGLTNYWGYNPVSFFAPHSGYSSIRGPHGPLDDFRNMVKALHQAGIEVILDVVYNHTAEGNDEGPIFCFKGLANSIYYILDGDGSSFANYSGTGNTLNANNSIVRRLILDSLCYWVEEMHVDGFRFDLASIFSRDESGQPLANPPILWDIETEPCLAGTKLIAEAWDAAGLYQVGSFVGDRWKEWNGKFRDDVRSFWRADNGTASRAAARFLASPDIYAHGDREPEQSVNFVTCHDGFTLNDLVSYNQKHNLANLEGNRDGYNQNLSWNCGVEGPSNDPAVEMLRNRQVKNFLAVTLLSLGVPMILMGDEVRRTQYGNNNAYCQDDEISWLDWSLVEKHFDIHGFVRRLIRIRLNRDMARLEHGMTLAQFLRTAEIQWHGTRLHQPDWSEESHSVALSAVSLAGSCRFHIMINAFWETLRFALPPVSVPWRRIIDTFLPYPDDISDQDPVPVRAAHYDVRERSLVVLISEDFIPENLPTPGRA